jgi:hypothetical protein
LWGITPSCGHVIGKTMRTHQIWFFQCGQYEKNYDSPEILG